MEEAGRRPALEPGQRRVAFIGPDGRDVQVGVYDKGGHLLAVLHLLGHDHQDEREAVEMEAVEVELLASLGYGNPYT